MTTKLPEPQLSEPQRFTCPRCGMRSFNLYDIREGYCGRCHDWTGSESMTTHEPRSTSRMSRTMFIDGRPLYYRLGGDDGHTPIPVTDWSAPDEADVWAIENRRVALTTVSDISVSTVFLVLDHALVTGTIPLLFETMVFGIEDDHEYQWRYATWDEAEAGHDRIVAALKRAVALAVANALHKPSPLFISACFEIELRG